MAGHCCAEGAREHEYKAYWRKREEEEDHKKYMAAYWKKVEKANEEWRKQNPKFGPPVPQPTVSAWGFFKWLIGLKNG